ncbi:glycosyltransferase family 2 protein [Paracerasibacillus soli]|uniref:Glycosyltransferase n=1 Tax=Paracerasibacillus soli TaxID=480284 RepID=A0ABU5CSL0_9BACI|nr:glycosyltransferase [Virgibacillus soli]MDY0409352.1 glycosyltransferase [Virgibacillus soli]
MCDEYKLSVVVLVYNTEDYLRECLDSLVNQTLDSIEIIAIDDESTDNSREILKEYEEKFKNIKTVFQENTGGATAGNRGLRMASGKYVAIIDSDDILPLDAYETLYNEAEKENADVTIGKPLILIDGVTKEILYKFEQRVWQNKKVINNISEFYDLFYDSFYWNKIFNRKFLVENECFMPDGMLYADRPMVHRAYIYARKISILDDVVYYWRKRGKEAQHKSITQLQNSLSNYADRLESIKYQIFFLTILNFQIDTVLSRSF